MIRSSDKNPGFVGQVQEHHRVFNELKGDTGPVEGGKNFVEQRDEYKVEKPPEKGPYNPANQRPEDEAPSETELLAKNFQILTFLEENKRRCHEVPSFQHTSPSGGNDYLGETFVRRGTFLNEDIQAIHDEIVTLWNNNVFYRETLVTMVLDEVTDGRYSPTGFIPGGPIQVETDFLKAFLEDESGERPFVPAFKMSDEDAEAWRQLREALNEQGVRSDFSDLEASAENWKRGIRAIQKLDADVIPESCLGLVARLEAHEKHFSDMQRTLNVALHGVATALRTMVIDRLIDGVDRTYAQERFAVFLNGGPGSGKGYVAKLLQSSGNIRNLPEAWSQAFSYTDNPIWLIADEAGEAGGSYMHYFAGQLQEHDMYGIYLHADRRPMDAIAHLKTGALQRSIQKKSRITNISHLSPQVLEAVVTRAMQARGEILQNPDEAEVILEQAREDLRTIIVDEDSERLGYGDLGWGYLWSVKNLESIQSQGFENIAVLATSFDYENDDGVIFLDSLEQLPSMKAFVEQIDRDDDDVFYPSLKEFEIEAIIQFLLFRDEEGSMTVLDEADAHNGMPYESPLVYSALGIRVPSDFDPEMQR